MGKLLRADEVRDRLELGTTATVYRWAKSGSLPCVILSARALRFREEDVERFIRDRLSAPPLGEEAVGSA